MIEIGSVYRLRDDENILGDYSGTIVLIEAGPRGEGTSAQYRVSWGNKSWQVDWVDVNLLDGSTKLVDYDRSSLIYIAPTR